MPLIDRIGIDMGAKLSVEDGLRWAAAHGLRYVDFRLDTGPEAFAAFTPARCASRPVPRCTPSMHRLYKLNMVLMC